MTNPAVSVVLSAYNAERYVGDAVESILAQTFRDFEFLIVDDGSTDGTRAVLERYAAADHRVRVISRENRGLIFSLNQLLAEARAPLVARMDADDMAHPERFAKQAAYLAANPACGVLGTWSRRMDAAGALQLDYVDRYPVTAEDFAAAVGVRPLVMHPSVMYRKALVQEVGGYHVAFRHAEDFDLWLRLSDRTQICNLPEPLMIYRKYDGQVSNRHLLEQSINAGISLHAWKFRREGRPDPTRDVDRLPSVEDIDAFFGRAGVEKEILQRVVPQILTSREALTGGGLRVIRRHLRYGNAASGLWRAVARLCVAFGEWGAGLSLAATLLNAGPRLPAAAVDRQSLA